MLLRPAAGKLEGVLKNAIHARAGHHRFLDHCFAVGALENFPSNAGVFSFGVLPNDVEIDVARLSVAQWAGHAREELDRAEADVLIEMPPELQ